MYMYMSYVYVYELCIYLASVHQAYISMVLG